jgi:ADP-glucose pyrophosphorylase
MVLNYLGFGKKDLLKDLSLVYKKKVFNSDDFIFIKPDSSKLNVALNYMLDISVYSNDLSTVHVFFAKMVDLVSKTNDSDLDSVLMHLAVDANNELSLDFKNCSAYKMFAYSRDVRLGKALVTANFGYSSLENNYGLVSPLKAKLESKFLSEKFDYDFVKKMDLSKLLTKHSKRVRSASLLPSEISKVVDTYFNLIDLAKLLRGV